MGSFGRIAGHALLALAASEIVPGAHGSALAQEAVRHEISIARIDLPSALRILARQTGISVGGTDDAMRSVRVGPLAGRMRSDQAIERLLRGTPFKAEMLSSGAYRIVRRTKITRARPASAQGPAPLPQPDPPHSVSNPPIIVTASKRSAQIEDYPVGAFVIDLSRETLATRMGNLDALLADLPITASTHLGPGRNKIFVRGIADSSFNGPTQATVGLYFGEYRLTYSAPNPDLRLYDVERVELLEGPQGTLYGTGALGGVLRMTPVAPATDQTKGTVWAGASAVEGGGEGFDVAAQADLPLCGGSGLHVLGYRGRMPGYIDDRQRGLRDVNSTRVSGWRASAMFDAGDRWTITLDGLQQMLDTADGQYSEPSVGKLARRSSIAQPFDSDVTLAGLTVRKSWDDLELVSATNITRSDLDTRFDATGIAGSSGTMAFDERRGISLINHETRLSRSGTSNPAWVVGLSAVENDDSRRQFLGEPENPALLIDTSTHTIEVAGFGEAILKFADRFDATAGARLVWSRIASERLFDGGIELDPTRHDIRFLPSIALGWHLNDALYSYVRYQVGYRSGGVSVDGSASETSTLSRFDSDTIDHFEGGLRGGIPGIPYSNITILVSYADWRDIQADIIDDQGFPLTRNVGDGKIYGLSLTGEFAPAPDVRLSARAFVNETSFTPTDGAGTGEETSLPNVAELGATLAVDWQVLENEQRSLSVKSGVTYVGKSILGNQPEIQKPQGKYALVDFSLTYKLHDLEVVVSAENLLDTAANQFSLGNPFTVSRSSQATPVRPRTFGISAKLNFGSR